MLDRNWFLAWAAIGIFDAAKQSWTGVGAGVFVYDGTFVWYVTAMHLIRSQSEFLHLVIHRKQKDVVLFDISSVHKQTKTEWIYDDSNDIAATIFPADPSFELKAAGFDFFLRSHDMRPSMACYSLGWPYGMEILDASGMTPYVLDGCISGINKKSARVYVTTPIFPLNDGGPILMCKSLADENGNVSIGELGVYLGGIVSRRTRVSQGGSNNSPDDLSSIQLGEVIPSEAIEALLQSAKATNQRTMVENQKISHS